MLLSFLIVSLTASSQPTDSLALVPVPKYVLYRIFHDLEAFKICDSLQRAQAEHIGMAVETLTVMDSIIRLQRSEIIYLDKEAKLMDERLRIKTDQIYEERAEKKRWKLTTFIGGALIVLMVIL